MFWVSAMGFHIWRMFTFSSVMKDRRGDLTKLVSYTLYAQGVPALICVITAIVDATKQGTATASVHHPNMGVFRCFLGASKNDQSYLTSPRFIYSDMFIILIQLVNIYFLSSVIIVLYRGWENQAKLLHLKG